MTLLLPQLHLPVSVSSLFLDGGCCRNPSKAFYQAFQPGSRLRDSKAHSDRYGTRTGSHRTGMDWTGVCVCVRFWLTDPRACSNNAWQIGFPLTLSSNKGWFALLMFAGGAARGCGRLHGFCVSPPPPPPPQFFPLVPAWNEHAAAGGGVSLSSRFARLCGFAGEQWWFFQAGAPLGADAALLHVCGNPLPPTTEKTWLRFTLLPVG